MSFGVSPGPFGPCALECPKIRKLEKAGTVDFKKHPHGRWGKGPGCADPRVPAGLPFPVPEILEFLAFRASEKFFQQFSRDFPGVFLENPRTDPGNSHSLLEFSEKVSPKCPGHRFDTPGTLSRHFLDTPEPGARRGPRNAPKDTCGTLRARPERLL